MIAGEYNLVDDWVASTLGQVAKLVKDKVDPSSAPECPYVGLEHIEAHTMTLVGTGRGSDVKSTKTRFSAGDVLYGKLRPYLNKVVQPDFDGMCSTDILVFTESDQLDSGYLAHYLNQLWVAGRAHHLSTGVELPRVDWKRLSTLPISYPASKENQRVIVRLIDESRTFTRSASTHLALARLAIERLLPAELTAAFREATEAADPASEAVFLKYLLREPLKNGYSARPVNSETPYRVLTLTATTSGVFDGRFFKYTEETFTEDSPFWLLPGDVLIQRGNTAEYVGVPALYDGPPNSFLYPDLMIRARALDGIDPRYLWYMLLAPQSRNFLRERATGSAGNMPKINQRVLNEVPIPVPPVAVRDAIVQRLEKAMALATDAGERLSLGGRAVERTSQSVLATALRGTLAGIEETA